MNDPTPPKPTTSHAAPKRRAAATAVFVFVVGGVVAVFAMLGTQGRPPAMPPGAHHTLRLNLQSELIGVETDPPVDPVAASGRGGFREDKKAVETRINVGCQACHGLPPIDLSGHACATIGRCVPPHHPPKAECIKCHRMSR